MNFLNFSTTKLAEIWNEANGWRWPEDLGVKPEGWKAMNIDEQAKILAPITIKIKKMIGEKELLRYHILNLCRTNEEFERWWDTEHKKFLKKILARLLLSRVL
ncbi:hypothetical protein [Anaerotignum propionicum]|uniref:hypothetical protein n=1 Tax=Anaerotignum propionicum TaxID=28446 RepID=UPI00289CC8FB|nr:hypothetical protein [Anaerotignum propionicum]